MAESSRDIPGVIAPPPLIYLGGLALGSVGQLLIPVEFITGRWVKPVGWGLVMLGVLGAAWAIRTMVRANTPLDPGAPTKALVAEGPFRHSRNPIYVCFAIVYLGLALLLNSAWVLALLPAVLIVVHIGVIRREEAYLERRFGEPYLEYKSRVRRWL